MKKNRKTNKTLEKETLKNEYTLKLIPSKNILTGISNRSRDCIKTNNLNKPFDDLYSLLSNKSILIQAFGNIQKNKGSLTPGIDLETAYAMSMKKIEQIASELKTQQYRFSLIKRKWIPKLKIYKLGEKRKNRPLGIPTFRDLIVQEAIRLILEAIYEPIFEHYQCNFGFRPKYGTHHAVANLRKQAVGSTIAIEGDIEGAYDNVDHDILMKILEKRIADKKFLKLLQQGFKSGILDQGQKLDNLSGVPQGGIASPILFNIYMHEFDLYIKNELQEEINKINLEQDRSIKPRNKIYDNLSTKIIRARKKYTDIKAGRKYLEIPNPEKIILKEKLEKLKSLVKERTKMPSLRMDKRLIKINYVRYADDWLILTNCTKEVAEKIKNNIENWLNTNLKLKLSPAKTKITNLKINSAKFLGFSIKTYNKRRITKSPFGELEKSAGWDLIFDIDKDRLLDKLVLKHFCNLKHKPIAKNPWTVLQPEEIIKRYNYMLRGLANYYFPVIDRLSYFQYIVYILEFSCKSTFAKKYKSKITKIAQKYGKPLTIKVTEKIQYPKLNQTKEISKTYSLMDYLTLKEKVKYKKYNWKQSKFINIPQENIFAPMSTINWRTYKNLDNICCICGTDKHVEQHHIRHIKKGEVIGFAQIMKQLNRRTIPLCRTHHLEVHNHKYDDIKLSDLIGIERFLT